eukprot:3836354-Amphidinium_carterae.1
MEDSDLGFEEGRSFAFVSQPARRLDVQGLEAGLNSTPGGVHEVRTHECVKDVERPRRSWPT